MEPIILSHSSAIRAIRHERGVYNTLHWHALGKLEQRTVLADAVAGAKQIDFEALAAHEAWDSEEPDDLHLIVGSPTARAHTVPGLHCHVRSQLPAGALLKIEPGLYCVSPAYAALQIARAEGFVPAFSLLMELLGTYSLPAMASDRPAAGGMDDDARGDVEQAHYWCDPAIEEPELAALARRATGGGNAAFRAAARYVRASSASPGETIMYGMFGLPMSYGGFACAGLPQGGMLLNHRVDFESRAARMASGIPYAICDAYIPAALTDLEYNGLGHETTEARIHDANRNNGLRGEGVRIIVINRKQMRDIEALEAIAQSIYRDARVRFRYRIAGYRTRQARLLNDLRRAVELPPV